MRKYWGASDRNNTLKSKRGRIKLADYCTSFIAAKIKDYRNDTKFQQDKMSPILRMKGPWKCMRQNQVPNEWTTFGRGTHFRQPPSLQSHSAASLPSSLSPNWTFFPLLVSLHPIPSHSTSTCSFLSLSRSHRPTSRYSTHSPKESSIWFVTHRWEMEIMSVTFNERRYVSLQNGCHLSKDT